MPEDASSKTQQKIEKMTCGVVTEIVSSMSYKLLKNQVRFLNLLYRVRNGVFRQSCFGNIDRGRRTTKLSTVVDTNGVSHNMLLTPANLSDMRIFESAAKKLSGVSH